VRYCLFKHVSLGSYNVVSAMPGFIPKLQLKLNIELTKLSHCFKLQPI
jgi:hypothetical protein